MLTLYVVASISVIRKITENLVILYAEQILMLYLEKIPVADFTSDKKKFSSRRFTYQMAATFIDIITF